MVFIERAGGCAMTTTAIVIIMIGVFIVTVYRILCRLHSRSVVFEPDQPACRVSPFEVSHSAECRVSAANKAWQHISNSG